MRPPGTSRIAGRSASAACRIDLATRFTPAECRSLLTHRAEPALFFGVRRAASTNSP